VAKLPTPPSSRSRDGSLCSPSSYSEATSHQAYNPVMASGGGDRSTAMSRTKPPYYKRSRAAGGECFQRPVSTTHMSSRLEPFRRPIPFQQSKPHEEFATRRGTWIGPRKMPCKLTTWRITGWPTISKETYPEHAAEARCLGGATKWIRIDIGHGLTTHLRCQLSTCHSEGLHRQVVSLDIAHRPPPINLEQEW
jgi:hypothetical protein